MTWSKDQCHCECAFAHKLIQGLRCCHSGAEAPIYHKKSMVFVQDQ